MNDHEKFKALLKDLNLDYLKLSELLGMKYTSVKNQLAPSKSLPKWAFMMLYMWENKK